MLNVVWRLTWLHYLQCCVDISSYGDIYLAYLHLGASLLHRFMGEHCFVVCIHHKIIIEATKCLQLIIVVKIFFDDLSHHLEWSVWHAVFLLYVTLSITSSSSALRPTIFMFLLQVSFPIVVGRHLFLPPGSSFSNSMSGHLHHLLYLFSLFSEHSKSS